MLKNLCISNNNIHLCHHHLTTIYTFKTQRIDDDKLSHMAQKIIFQNIKDMSEVYCLIKDFTNEEKINLLYVYLKRAIQF